MSQERTEQPTSKRLRDAAERGQVARSKEVQDVVQLAAALMTLSWVGSYMVRTLADRVGAGLSRIDGVAHRTVMPSELTAIATSYLGWLALIVGPVMLTAVVAAPGRGVRAGRLERLVGAAAAEVQQAEPRERHQAAGADEGRHSTSCASRSWRRRWRGWPGASSSPSSRPRRS